MIIEDFVALQKKVIQHIMDTDSILRRLERELERYKEGDLTNEEIQNLCHNLHLRRPDFEFQQGCKEFQNKLLKSGTVKCGGTFYTNDVAGFDYDKYQAPKRIQIRDSIRESL